MLTIFCMWGCKENVFFFFFLADSGGLPERSVMLTGSPDSIQCVPAYTEFTKIVTYDLQFGVTCLDKGSNHVLCSVGPQRGY